MAFNLNEEVIDGHLVTGEVKQLWSIQMETAQKILDVCKKYNLRIWADGGTLLGAVRHKGFIPWDDDMDFVMMREDFEKFMEVGPAEFKEPYFFQTFHSDNICGGTVKIRRSDTAAIDSNYRYMRPRNYGIFVDIFVLDAAPDDREKFKRQFRKISRYRRLLNRYVVYNKQFNKTFRMKVVYCGVVAYFLFNKPEKVENRIKKILMSNRIEDNRYMGLINFYAQWRPGCQNVWLSDKHWYDETVELPFHDMTIPAPKEYHKVLTENFGDYMTPVKGLEFHSMVKYDCNRSYVEVIKELERERSSK